jgi:hypothetical protein
MVFPTPEPTYVADMHLRTKKKAIVVTNYRPSFYLDMFWLNLEAHKQPDIM